VNIQPQETLEPMDRTETGYRRRLVGRPLHRARVKRGLTQADVARHLGYTTAQFVSNIERGIALPPDNSLLPLGRLLKLPPAALVRALGRYEEKVAIINRKRRMALVRN
jgi:transcriptional regulator with XRE-family HTH domain